jgi:hypothetical protein
MEDDIDTLFKLPLGEFTPARNALAARLKKAGEQAEADAAKALPKPSVPAWVVNQLYWQHREAFDRLIEAGDRYRQAQSKQQTYNPARMRELLEARRDAQAALLPIATAVLHDAGYGDTRNMLRRVTSTLEALATYGSLPDAPRAGRLTAEVEPPGFDLLAGLVPPSGGSRRKVEIPKPADHKNARAAAVRSREEERKRLVAAAKAAVREAERALRAASTQAERTAAAFEAAAKRAKQSERRRVEAEKQLAKIVTEADAARVSARETEANAKQATLAAESAERLLEQARRKLDELP